MTNTPIRAIAPMQLANLAPLIAASEAWAEDPTRRLWLEHAPETGRISLAHVAPDPETHFADIVLLDALEQAPMEVTRPTVFVAWPSGHHQLQLPISWAEGNAPYIGRPYALRQFDCYSLVRDWMARERGIVMDWLTETPERLANEWLTDGAFETNPEIHKWDRVITPEAGDGILFAMNPDGSGRANHAGVYLGGGRFLHHLPNRASTSTALDGLWRARVTAFTRWKG
jgi:cell wall-associated NlpC family hydrolase